MKDFHSSSLISTEYDDYDDTDDYDYNDETDIGYDGDYILPTDVDYNETISSNQAENINSTNNDYKVNTKKLVSQKGYNIDNKTSNIHIMKFHSFSKAQGKINFGTIFYFIGKIIPYNIIYRSRITYNSTLRNLQTGVAESVRTDCIITNKSLAGLTLSYGINVNYNCSANASIIDSISNIQLNTDVNMILRNETELIESLDFNGINFNGNSSEEAKHIQENNEPIITQAYLKNTTATIEKNILKFIGIYEEKSLSRLRRLSLSDGQIIPMNLKTKLNNQNYIIKSYNCTFNKLSNNNAELKCDISKSPINTNVQNLHLSNGISNDGTFLTIEMDNWQNNDSTVVSDSESRTGFTLKDAVASVDKYILKFTGNFVNYKRLLRRLDIIENFKITMNFSDINDKIKTYNCLLNITNNITPIADQIICNTSGNPIKTNPRKLHKSSGISSRGDLITIQMKNFNSTSLISTEYNEVFNSTLIIPTDYNEKFNSTSIVSTEYNEATDVDKYIPPTAEDYNDNSTSNQSENVNATAKDSTVNSCKPISQKGYKSDNKSSPIQIMKFHSFSKAQGKINFGTIFYFIGKIIPYGIIYRSRITYNSRLRNLQTGVAESVRTDCNITNKSLAGTIQPNGINVNYECSANASIIDSISNIQLNTDVNMTLESNNGTIYESIGFNEISFNGNASEEAKNIQENDEEIKTQAYLKNTNATIEEYILIFTGKYQEESLSRLRRLSLSNGQIIPMKLMTKVNNINDTIIYNCTFNHLINDNAELDCDTSKCPINTNIQNLHLSNGISDDGTFLTIEMDNWETEGNKSLVATTYSINTRSKTSSGLSGGAIAGIVIACVVVVLAIIFSIIYLRKSEPSLNKTPVLDKKYDSSIKVFE